MKVKNYRTYYYTGSWRKDVQFNSAKITDDKPKSFSQKVRASTRKEASSKLLRQYP